MTTLLGCGPDPQHEEHHQDSGHEADHDGIGCSPEHRPYRGDRKERPTQNVAAVEMPRINARVVIALGGVNRRRRRVVDVKDSVDDSAASPGLPGRHLVGNDVSELVRRHPEGDDEVARVIFRLHRVTAHDGQSGQSTELRRPQHQQGNKKDKDGHDVAPGTARLRGFDCGDIRRFDLG
jgi:hypothetical protein